ncbi:MAG: 4-hydroxyphenylacetate 3-hydroxylase family protein [Metallosphaera sp.]
MKRGKDYIESIRASPPVTYYEGEAVTDVINHPAYKIPVKTVASYYDLHWKEEYKSLRAYNRDVGEETSVTLVRPRSKEELLRLGEALVKIYEYYRGFFGRSPDYMNLWTMVFFAHAEDYFGKNFGSKFMENAMEIYRESTKRDHFYTHAIVAPMYDRSRPPSQWEDPYIQIGVTEERQDGVVVRGAAMICTAGPYAEMLWYLPNMRRDSDPRYAIYFSIPTTSKGVRFISRRGFQPREGGEFEYPISSKWEESDSILVLDNVLVPWDRIIFYKKPELIEDLMWHTVGLRGWFNWHFMIQHYARLKFLAGLAMTVTEAANTNTFINVQEKIGEILIYVAMNEAALYGSVARAQELPNIVRPDPYISISASHFNMKAVPRANEILRLITAGSSIPIPAGAKDFTNPEERAYLDKYMAMKGLDALERVKTFNLLWDVIGSEVGIRYEQYDRFSRGDPTIRWAQTYTEVFKDRKGEFVRLVKEILDQMPNPRS